jgi:hypothetical protein
MKRLFSMLFCGLLLATCGNPTKETDLEDNSTGELLAHFEKQAEVFTFSPDTVIDIIGKEGTEINIPRGCLVHQDGALPTDKIIIILKECYSASDIVFNNLTTQTKIGLLETGGMIYIEAKSDGKQLMIREGKAFKIKYPRKGELKQDMKLYKGNEENGYVVWDENPISGIAIDQVFVDTIYSELNSAIIYHKELDYYLFNSSEMQWLNCDKIIEGEKTELYVDLNTSAIPNLRLMCHNIKLAAYPQLENGKMVFRHLPINEPATIIGFYKSGGKHYIYKKEIVVSAGMTDNAAFWEVTLEELKTAVDAIKWSEQV